MIYPGVSDARWSSRVAIGAWSDPLFGFVSDVTQWVPTPEFAAQGFVSLAALPPQELSLASDVRALHLDGLDSVASNVFIVGSSTNMSEGNVMTRRVAPEELTESTFSNRNPDVLAVGEGIFAGSQQGTSLSAPQVAGLSSYLWALSSDLRHRSPDVTKQTIVQNARNRIIDAYAAALSLDAAVMPTPENAPVRLAILDTNNDGGFTELDIDAYLRRLYFVDQTGSITNEAPTSTAADFSRYDLNGDGFTTSGSRRERFDLDRVGSAQYGRTQYSTVTQDIEGQVTGFDETALTDIEILCYYAYSPLYEGNPDARKTLLRGRCGTLVTVAPVTITLAPSQNAQFAATVTGRADQRVAWATDGVTNAITDTGLFTAGSMPGTFKVRASSVADPNAVGEATVKINGCPMVAGTYSGSMKWQVASSVGGRTGEIGHPPETWTVTITQNDCVLSGVWSSDSDSHSGTLVGVRTLTTQIGHPLPFYLTSCGGGTLSDPSPDSDAIAFDATGTAAVLVLTILRHDDCHHPGGFDSNGHTYFMSGALLRVVQ
jgi:hypothetical protein